MNHGSPESDPLASPPRKGLRDFVLAMAALAALTSLLGFVPVPASLVGPVTLLVTAVYIALPVLAVFRVGDYAWTKPLSVIFIVIGASAHVGLAWTAVTLGEKGPLAALAGALSQTGLLTWCVGLGALLATSLKEKNLLIPVSLFLAAFDVFTVLTPIGPTRVMLEQRPEIFQAIAFEVPKVQETPPFGPVAATARIGPADFLFMAMFFVALHRFGMRRRQTFLWLVPSLLAYMVFVHFVGPLPAMVPVGLCVLAVNWRDFSLSKQEWASTALVAALGVGLILFGLSRQEPPAEPSTPAPAQGSAK
jgi:hypothetical protein